MTRKSILNFNIPSVPWHEIDAPATQWPGYRASESAAWSTPPREGKGNASYRAIAERHRAMRCFRTGDIQKPQIYHERAQVQ